jgi:hypothetical protein
MISVRWKVLSWGLLWIGLTLLPGCSLLSSKVAPFTCAVSPLYNEDGTLDETAYVVTKECLRGMQKRLDACYKE